MLGFAARACRLRATPGPAARAARGAVVGDATRTPSCCWSTRRSTPQASAPSRGSGRVDGTPVIDVDRGGRITWHGPGQLVGYPIVALHEPVDVVAYVRRLEEALIRTLRRLRPGDHPGRGPQRRLGDRGGRAPDRKVAAIGVRVLDGVTMHGFALNCDPDLSWFDRSCRAASPTPG